MSETRDVGFPLCLYFSSKKFLSRVKKWKNYKHTLLFFIFLFSIILFLIFRDQMLHMSLQIVNLFSTILSVLLLQLLYKEKYNCRYMYTQHQSSVYFLLKKYDNTYRLLSESSCVYATDILLKLHSVMKRLWLSYTDKSTRVYMSQCKAWKSMRGKLHKY